MNGSVTPGVQGSRILAKVLALLGGVMIMLANLWKEVKSFLRVLPRLAALVTLGIMALCFAKTLINEAVHGSQKLGSIEMSIQETRESAGLAATTNVASDEVSKPVRVDLNRPSTLPYALAILSLLAGFSISVYGVTVLARSDG